MLLVLSVPFADLRTFLADPTAKRLIAPQWPDPMSDREFIRGFGPVRLRPMGGAPGWMGEHRICDVRRGIRFAHPGIVPRILDAPHLLPQRVYRRFFFDGIAVAKFDFGLAIRGTTTQTNAASMSSLLRTFLDTSVRVRIPARPPRQLVVQHLHSAGSALARAYQLATTPLPKISSQEPSAEAASSMLLGAPVLFVEYTLAEKISVPRPSQVVVDARERHGFILHHSWYVHEQKRISTWFLQREKSIVRFEDDYLLYSRALERRRNARHLRVCLVRRHAENECLRTILRQVMSGHIAPRSHTEHSDSLQHYFDKAISRLWRFETEQRDIGLEQVARYADRLHDKVLPGETEALYAQVETVLTRLNIRPNIRRKVLTAARGNIFFIGDTVMGNKASNRIDARGAQGIVGINVAVKSINHSFNNHAPKENGPLRDNLKELRKLVLAISRVAPDKAAVVARDFDTFTQEASSATPREDMLKVSGKGIVEAAKTLAEIAAPVQAVVKTIVDLVLG